MTDSTGMGFEAEVFSAVTRTLRACGLGLIPEQARLYRQKPYYSEARKQYIRTDVSIEVTLPGAHSPVLIWIWECKDHSRKITVGEVEEFDAKLQQVGADNTKGTIVTRIGFQASAIEYAKSRKIGLVMLTPERQLSYCAYARPPAVADKAVEVMTLSADAVTDSPIGGMDLSGRPVAYTNLYSYIFMELYLCYNVAFSRVCCCCGAHTLHAALDVEYLAVDGHDLAEVKTLNHRAQLRGACNLL